MPKVRTLLIVLVAGIAVGALFAFTIVGLVGEAVVLLSLSGLLLRGLATMARLTRQR